MNWLLGEVEVWSTWDTFLVPRPSVRRRGRRVWSSNHGLAA